jgi:MFS family permease
MMASTVPLVVLGPIGGAIADHHSRRSILIVTDLLRAITIGAFTVFAAVSRAITPDHISMLILVAACNGIMSALFTPAVQAIVPDLVERHDLATANSLAQFSSQAAVLVGPALGGVMYVQWGAPVLLAFDAISFAYEALATSLIPADRTSARETVTLAGSVRRYLAETIASIGYIRTQPGMLPVLLTFAAVNFLFMPVFVLLPLYVRSSLAAPAEWYGFLLAGSGAGALGGAAIAGLVLTRRRMNGQVLAACIAGVAGAIVILSTTSTMATALAAFFVIGLSSALLNVLVVTAFQIAVPSELRGRVMALVVTVSMAATPLGMGLGGLMGDIWRDSLRAVYAACGGAMMLLVVATAASARTYFARLGSG